MTRLLTALLLAAALLPAFGAPAGVAQAAEGMAEVNGVGRLVKPSAGFSFAIKIGDNGRALGALSYDDHAARLRLHATRIDSVALADGSVTIAGVGRNGKVDGQAFRLIATEARAGRPARLTFEATDAAGKPYRAESNLRIGSVRVVPAAPRGRGRASPTAAPPSPTATPTRTPTPVPTPTPGTSASQKTEVGYAPDAGARLTSADGAVAVEVPPGAIAEPATFSHAELAGPVNVPEARLARTWKLEAQASSDGHPIHQFLLPLSLSVRYTDADLAVLGVPAERLQLYYQDDAGAWIRIPATVDTTARTVTAAVDHFTVFALGTGEAFETAGGAGTSFVDNFANLNAWTTSAGTGAVAGNILTANGTGGADDRFMLTNASAYTDLTYEAGVSDQSVNANHRAGTIFRYSAASGGSYYFAYLNNGQVGLGKVTNGGALANVGPAPVNIGYTQGTFVWLRVVATAANLEVYTAPAASGPWTQRIVAVDATPLTSGGVGLLNDNTGTTTRAARFRDPLVTVTLPQDWSGITQQAGRPGLLWDRTTGSPHGGTGSLQLFSGNGANVGLTAQTTNNANTCGTVCAFGGWIKTTGVSAAAGDGAKIALLEKPSNTQTIVATQTGTAGWTQYTARVTLQAGTTSIETQVILDGSGVANFDDIVVNAPIVSDGGLESAGPTGASYFDDNLADPTAFQFSSGNGSTAGGVLTTTGTAGFPGLDAWTVANSDDLTDFTWIAAVNPTADSANLYAGLQFRWQNASNYYGWVIQPGTNSVRLVKSSGGSFTTLQTNSYATGANTWYWLRIVASGNGFTGAIAPATGAGGGPGAWTQFATYTDATPIAYGRVGMGNAVFGGTPIPAQFKGPSLRGTFPAGWSSAGVQQVTGRPGALWDGRSGTAQAGARSLQLFSADVMNVGYLARTGLAVAGNTTHAVEGWIKTASVTSPANGASIVVVETPSGIQTTIGGVTGTTAWTLQTGSFTTQPTTTSIELRLYLKGSGAANFDGLAVTAVGAPPVPPPPPSPPPPTGSQHTLYAVTQAVTYGSTSNLANSVVQPQGFDGGFASATGTLAASTANRWTWSAIEDTTFASVTDAFIQVRFYQSGWVNDTFVLEYSTDNWASAQTLATYSSSNPPPTTVATFTSASLKSAITTPALANAVQVRFRGVAAVSGADTITLNVDQVRLTIFGFPPAFDSFDRADSATTLGTGSPAGYHYSGNAESGQPWQTDGSGWGISGNAAYSVGPVGSGNYVRLVSSTLPADQTVTITVPAAYDGQVGVITRVASDWNGNLVWVGLDASGLVEVWTLTNGSWNGPLATGSATLSFPMTLSATAAGTSLTVKVNGAAVALSPGFTIPNPPGAVGAGMYIDTTGATWAQIDSFEVR